MREHALMHNVNRISMPKIWGGFNELKWEKIRLTLLNVFEHHKFHISIYEPNISANKKISNKQVKPNLLKNHLDSLNTVGNPNHFSPPRKSSSNTNIAASLKKIGFLSGNLSENHLKNIVDISVHDSLAKKENYEVESTRKQIKLMFNRKFPKNNYRNTLKQVCQSIGAPHPASCGITFLDIHSKFCIISFMNREFLSSFQKNINCPAWQRVHQIRNFPLILKKHDIPHHSISETLISLFEPKETASHFTLSTFYKKIRDHNGLQSKSFYHLSSFISPTTGQAHFPLHRSPRSSGRPGYFPTPAWDHRQ
jgi:hypothetical protein